MSEAARGFWQHAYSDLRSPLRSALERQRFAGAFAGAGRRMGQGPLSLAPEEKTAIARADLRVAEHWTLDDLARAALLLRASECLEPTDHEAFVRDLFLRGDNRERRALLQTLVMLPEPQRFLATAIEACRTNVLTVFEAIAVYNPYPAAHFPELNFNQMVLKAMFMGVAVAAIEGLATRITPELVRMARAYGSERRAAGRSVPSDIDYICEASR